MKRHQQLLLKLYGLTIAISTIFPMIITIPESYFSNKKNILNVIFVKQGWFWTCIAILPLILLSNPSLSKVKCFGFRMILASLYWLLGVKVMHQILVYTGECSIENVTRVSDCKQQGGQWNGFDVSGHCL
jgi:hypothetical protein